MRRRSRWTTTTVGSATLLFDQNLAPSLSRRLADLYPDSIHVKEIDLDVGEDHPIWDYAKIGNLVIVTKDRDYKDLSKRLGHPPKVVLIRLGNCTREAVASLLRERYADVIALLRDENRGLLVLP